MAKKIEKITFHWSESIIISKTIDPNFNNREDANFLMHRDDAYNLIILASNELKTLDRYLATTCVTLHFECGENRLFEFDLKAEKPQILEWF